MYINLKDIQREPLAIDAALSVGDLEGPGGERMPVRGARLRGEASRGDRGVDLDARLTATVQVLCSRCTEPLELPIETDVSLMLVPAGAPVPAADDGPDEDEDRRFEVKDGKADLESIAREQIYLTLPLKPICRETCKGLCPVCGVNRNQEDCACDVEDVDPRLAPLLQFKQRRNPQALG
jgi:uncharacterized protein